MRRFILFILLTVCCSLGYADNTVTQAFKGTVTAVVFNNKHFQDIQNQTFTLQRKSANSVKRKFSADSYRWDSELARLSTNGAQELSSLL